MKTFQREQARKMRMQGKSYGDIAKELGISVGSAHRWCIDIQLTDIQKQRLKDRHILRSTQALKPWIERNKALRIQDIEKQQLTGVKDVGSISTRDLFLLGLGLYWGEGYKRGSQECAFTNSDPHIIRIMLRWFYEIYNISPEHIRAHVTINEQHRHEAERIMHNWSKEIAIPLEQFSSPTFIESKKVYADPSRIYRGTLRIKIRNGTSLRRRILASISVFEN